jgi:hypothetical protein
MSVVVWSMVGIALWHFTVLLPDRFAGGIIGAFLAALGGAVAAGYVLPSQASPPRTRRASAKVSGRFPVRSSRSRCPTCGAPVAGWSRANAAGGGGLTERR